MSAPNGVTPSSRRAERRAVQLNLSRTQLLDAAEEVFGRRGFHEATLKEVAEAAEFSVGALYTFFDSKDELFRQIFVRRGEEFHPALSALLADKQVSPREQLHALVDFEVGFFRARPHFGRLYLRYASATMLAYDRDIDAVLRDGYERAMREQADLIRRGQEARLFHSGDPEVLSRIFSALISTYQALDPAILMAESHAEDGLSLDELHQLVDRTFVSAPD